MAPAIVGSPGPVSQGASGAAVTPAWDAGASRAFANTLILGVVTQGSATLPTVPAGWRVSNQRAGTSSTASIFYKTATGHDAAPTVSAITSAVITAQLTEYSGCDADLNFVRDNGGAASGTTSPITATAGVAAASGELVVSAGGALYASAATATLADTFNNGATATDTTNNATSTVNHYCFGWGVTTSKASSQTDQLAFTGTPSDAVLVAVCLRVSRPPAPKPPGPPHVRGPYQRWLQGFGAARLAAPASTASLSANLTDSITLSDSITTSGGQYSRAITDSVTLAESLARTVGQPRAVTDSITLADSLSAQAGKTRSLTDSITLADVLSRSPLVFARTLADSITLAELLARTVTLPRGQTDSITLSDALVGQAGKTRTIVDSITLADALARNAIAYARQLADHVTLGDATSRTFTVHLAIVDSITLLDSGGPPPPPPAAALGYGPPVAAPDRWRPPWIDESDDELVLVLA